MTGARRKTLRDTREADRLPFAAPQHANDALKTLRFPKVGLLLEELQDVLGVGIGDRERLDTKLLLCLQRL